VGYDWDTWDLKLGFYVFCRIKIAFLKSKAQIMPMFLKSRFAQCGFRFVISFIYNKLSAEIYPPAFFDHLGMMNSGAITRLGRCASTVRVIDAPCVGLSLAVQP
jgi:hypothetical protein